MYNFKFFVSVGAVVVLIFPTHSEVTAAPAPAPHPCLWLLDYDHRHPEPTTSTTPKPGVVEDFAKLTNMKTNQLQKLITDWMLAEPVSLTHFVKLVRIITSSDMVARVLDHSVPYKMVELYGADPRVMFVNGRCRLRLVIS